MLAQVDKETRTSTSDGNDEEYVTDGFLVIGDEEDVNSIEYLKRNLASLKQDIVTHFKRVSYSNKFDQEFYVQGLMHTMKLSLTIYSKFYQIKF